MTETIAINGYDNRQIATTSWTDCLMQVWLFDIDGTLIKSGGVGQRSLEMAWQSLYGPLVHFGEIPFAGRTDYAIATDIFANHNVPDSMENRNALQAAYLRHLERNLPNCIGCVLPGVIELLEFLTQHAHVALGLLTGNIETAAFMKLKHFKIERYFKFGGYGNHDSDRNDVAARAYHSACESIGMKISREKVWVVGDTPHDIMCGQAIGAKTIAVTTGSYADHEMKSFQPNFLCSRLDELDRVSLLSPPP